MTEGPDASARGARSVCLIDEATGEELGRISEGELGVLQDVLEEESERDRDYWINADIVDRIASRRDATPHLVALLTAAVRSSDGVDVRVVRGGSPGDAERERRAQRLK